MTIPYLSYKEIQQQILIISGKIAVRIKKSILYRNGRSNSSMTSLYVRLIVVAFFVVSSDDFTVDPGWPTVLSRVLLVYDSLLPSLLPQLKWNLQLVLPKKNSVLPLVISWREQGLRSVGQLIHVAMLQFCVGHLFIARLSVQCIWYPIHTAGSSVL